MRRALDLIFLVALALGVVLIVLGALAAGLACFVVAGLVLGLTAIRMWRDGQIPGFGDDADR